ncbi:hypothetical protein CGMCC3_g17708 [Colletotrichum fructicola]|nr:uncharacterized protein CGMCC3_g17708 [Colletotrichum fructicola]KAE9566120.1 hypothetical protein CGMCC3_g17708 [Colletotrichum fructicola]
MPSSYSSTLSTFKGRRLTKDILTDLRHNTPSQGHIKATDESKMPSSCSSMLSTFVRRRLTKDILLDLRHNTYSQGHIKTTDESKMPSSCSSMLSTFKGRRLTKDILLDLIHNTSSQGHIKTTDESKMPSSYSSTLSTFGHIKTTDESKMPSSCSSMLSTFKRRRLTKAILTDLIHNTSSQGHIKTTDESKMPSSYSSTLSTFRYGVLATGRPASSGGEDEPSRRFCIKKMTMFNDPYTVHKPNNTEALHFSIVKLDGLQLDVGIFLVWNQKQGALRHGPIIGRRAHSILKRCVQHIIAPSSMHQSRLLLHTRRAVEISPML